MQAIGFVILALIFASTVAGVPGCDTSPQILKPSHKTRLSEKEVVALANAEALKQECDLAKYEPGQPEIAGGEDEWTVFYNGKMKAPGNHFLVWVNDQTSKCRLMPGE